MRKILFLITQAELGGAQRYVLEVVSSLDKGKFSFLVAAGTGKGNFLLNSLKNNHQQLKSLPVQTIPLRYLKRAPSPWEIFLSISEIVGLLEKEKPDVLFLCCTTAGFLGSIASKIYKLKNLPYNLETSLCVLYRIGGWSFLDPRPAWMNKVLLCLEKITSRFKNKIIVNTKKDQKTAVLNKICPQDKLVMIQNGIDAERLEFLSREKARKKITEHIAQDIKYEKIVGTIANFYKTKGLKYFIKAVHILNNKYQLPATKYIIIGDGKERKKIESLIREYSLENKVFLLGRIPQAYKYIPAFDVFVLPSLKEGFPWVILEAMAAGVPILATKTGGLPEIIKENRDGILVPTKNSQLLAEKTYWLLTHSNEAEEMAQRAKQKLKKEFTLKKMLEKTAKILLSC